ncbi:hypothetical protein SAMN05421504_101765 [Amycolatopsis xylanica]|uniref:N-acetyltransferase domain-containing protein n=2 Tax=Amycolatopsis xylanica TaxID=589385 RepID=A0A1H2U4J9_9PSEU|nr:hypothetical protein SAMN05421504_101765 [Amycolatopsis xylanica]
MFPPCEGNELAARLGELADAGMAFLGRDTLTEPIGMLRARFTRDGTRLFAVRGSAGLFGVTVSTLNPYQGEIDIALPGADEQSYSDTIAAVLRLCRSHLALRSVLRFEPNRDDRAAHFERAGLSLLGVLRGARYTGGAYHDQRVWRGVTG